jgi:hypothetical protein
MGDDPYLVGRRGRLGDDPYLDGRRGRLGDDPYLGGRRGTIITWVEEGGRPFYLGGR